MEWRIIGIFVVVIIVGLIRYFAEKDDEDNELTYSTDQQGEENVTHIKEEDNMEEQKPSRTKALAYEVLKQIGCQPHDTEEGRILFEYQGITFLMEAANDCMFVNMIWPWCHSFSKFDIDEFARVRQVVNDINKQGTLSVFYSITDSDEVAVHIKKHFLFVEQIPEVEEYLKLILNSFFRTARTLDLEIERCRMQECEKQV